MSTSVSFGIILILLVLVLFIGIPLVVGVVLLFQARQRRRDDAQSGSTEARDTSNPYEPSHMHNRPVASASLLPVLIIVLAVGSLFALLLLAALFFFGIPVSAR